MQYFLYQNYLLFSLYYIIPLQILLPDQILRKFEEIKLRLDEIKLDFNVGDEVYDPELNKIGIVVRVKKDGILVWFDEINQIYDYSIDEIEQLSKIEDE